VDLQVEGASGRREPSSPSRSGLSPLVDIVEDIVEISTSEHCGMWRS
jgi:hypothetical protein